MVGFLLVLSMLLTATTLLPGLDVQAVAIVLRLCSRRSSSLLAAMAAREGTTPEFAGTPRERATWTMPPLETLARPGASRARTIGLVVLRGYLLIAVALLAVKAVELAVGGG